MKAFWLTDIKSMSPFMIYEFSSYTRRGKIYHYLPPINQQNAYVIFGRNPTSSQINGSEGETIFFLSYRSAPVFLFSKYALLDGTYKWKHVVLLSECLILTLKRYGRKQSNINEMFNDIVGWIMKSFIENNKRVGLKLPESNPSLSKAMPLESQKMSHIWRETWSIIPQSSH